MIFTILPASEFCESLVSMVKLARLRFCSEEELLSLFTLLLLVRLLIAALPELEDTVVDIV